MAQFRGKYCNVKASGTAVATTGEATTDVLGDHTVYQVTDASHQVLDPQVAVTVYVNGGAPAGTYTVDRLFGKVTFDVALLGTDVVTLDASYLPMTTVAEAFGFDLSVMATSVDSTTFEKSNANGGWMTRTNVQHDCSGSVDRFFDVDALFTDAVAAGSVVCVEHWRDQATVDSRAWAIFEKSDVKGGAAALVNESASWSGSADADGRSVSFG